MRADALSLAAAAAIVAVAAPLPVEARPYLRHLAFGPGVAWSNYLVRGPETFRAERRIEVRAAPVPQERVTMILNRGEIFESVGQTEDGWVAISRDGVVLGYVSDGVVSALDG